MQPAETVPKSRNSLIFPLNSRKLWHHFHLPLTHWHHSSQAPWAKDLNRNYFSWCQILPLTINQFDIMMRIRISKIWTKKNTGPVMHPNLCVCFHSAVTFWLNDRLTVCWKAVNWLFCKSLPSLTKCLPGKMSPFDWVGFLCLTLLASGKRKVFFRLFSGGYYVC